MRSSVPEDLPKALAAAFIGILVLLTGLAALRAESESRQLHARATARQALDGVADSIVRAVGALRAEIAALAADPPRYRTILAGDAQPSSGEQPIWWSDGNVVDFVTAARLNLPEEQLVEFLDDAGPALQIVTTNDGFDVLLLKERVPTRDGTEWLGAGFGIADLIAAADFAGLVEGGLYVELIGENGTPVYWTTPTGLADPVATAVQLGNSRWELRAAPRESWYATATDWQSAMLVAILAAGSGLAVWALAKRPRSLSGQIARLTADLEQKDSNLSQLLRSRSQIENQLVTSLTVDLYTGLANRASFVEHLQSRLAKSRLAADGGVLVATVLLHKLGEIGRSMGATVAEEVIREAANRLQQTSGADTYLARTGECELTLCLALATAPDTAALTEQLLHALEARFVVGRRPFYVSAVVGYAASGDGYNHGPELLAEAALAANMAIAESQRFALFQPAAKEERITLLQLEADLLAALNGNELRLFFQPIVSVVEGHIVGFESLLRWDHPTESWIGPDRFIPLAESMGQMARISDWVLREGIAHSKQFSKLRADPLYINVNLTPRDLHRDLCGRLFELLDAVGLPPQCIRIEVTETAVVRDFRIAARLIAELNERGVRVVLDDFGTGYSSLGYLRDLPFHAVKIDKSFIHRMTTEARDFGLVKSIVGLVHYLGMECVAEGVETQEQLDLIAMVEFNCWQGHHFSRPLPASQVEPLIRGARKKPGVALAAS
jgi:predicted signal transduction protein with EAL and GGDEF domain